MSTGTSIVERALGKIGANSIPAPADPSSIVEGGETLGSMLQSWLSDNIDLGIVPLASLGDDLGEPADTTNAIIDNLALLLLPSFPNLPVTPTLVINARVGFDTVKRLYQNLTIPDKVVSSTLPRGQGNQRFFRPRVYAGKGATVDN